MSSELQRLVDELLMLFHESAQYHQDEQVRQALNDATGTVLGLRERLGKAARRYVVAVVGLSNVGKSTLLNALLGHAIAPKRNGPCTSAPIEFRFGPDLEVVAHYANRVARNRWSCPDIESVHQRLADLASESGTLRADAVQRVVVQAPFDILRGDLVIADTPGFGAVTSGDNTGSHDAIGATYLKTAAQVFWVVLGEQALTNRERSLHDQLFADLCDDVVVTGCDDLDDTDKARFRKLYADKLSKRRPRFHFVSGKLGMDARARQDEQQLENAGIPELEARIRELAYPTGREAAIRDSLVNLADDLSYWLAEFRDDRGLPVRVRWRPDSWDRWSAAPVCGDLRQRITTHLLG